MTELSDIERRVENEAPLAEARSREMVMLWIAGGVALDIAVAVGLALFFNNQLLNRLIVMIENTRRLAKNAPLLPRTTGGDEIAHLDKVFHEMAQALHEASEYKKELVSMVSHDLRTPLTSIQTSLALIEIGACGEIPDRVKAEIAVAERSATRLINLINDLLDIEKMEAGKFEMNLALGSSMDIMKQAVEACSAFAEQHKITIELPDKDLDLRADGERVVQVLVNLLSNAIKFSPDNSTITLDIVEQPDAFQFRVSDQGPGIPPEYKNQLFEKFKQVEGVTSTKLKGTGLGLAICKAIVQGHNGEIGVESEVGKGTTFWFNIPKATSVVAVAETVPA
jgi:signal transduction histidine kinase